LSALRQVPKRNEAGVGVQEIRGTRAEFGIINQSNNQCKAPFNLVINSHQILGNQGFT
jgi:hypothetical protein